MPTYITLITFTEKGLRTIKESPARAEDFSRQADSMGFRVKDVYWTTGGYDGVLVFDADDEATASAAVLSLAREGNVETQTLRAFDRSEMQSILDKLS